MLTPMFALVLISDLTMPVDVEFNEGDRVRVDLHIDTFRPLMTEYGGWVADLENVNTV